MPSPSAIEPLLPLSQAPTPSDDDDPARPPPSSSSVNLGTFPRRQAEGLQAVPQSDKAKGKQREPSLPRRERARPERRKGRGVMVRFTEGGIVAAAVDQPAVGTDADEGNSSRDLELRAEEADSIADLKWKIRASRPAFARRHLRLIHLGRVLSPTLTLVPYLAQQRERARALDPPAPGAGPPDEDGADDIVWLQCAVGLEMAEGEDETEPSETVANSAPLRGFDLLRATAGLSEDDVRTMRRQFHRTRDVDVELDEATQALEESWIDGTLTTANADAEPASTYSTLLNGFAISFFFPLLALFFFKDAESHSFLGPGREVDPSGGAVFSRKMQMAIMVALAVNLTLGLVMCLS